MTFEEMQRAMEFVVQYQARTEANLEKEREQRVYHDQQFAQLVSRITDLLVLQSSRLDSQDRERKSARQEHQETLARLDRILDLLARKS